MEYKPENKNTEEFEGTFKDNTSDRSSAYSRDFKEDFSDDPETKQRDPSNAGCIMSVIFFTLTAVFAICLIISILIPNEKHNSDVSEGTNPLRSPDMSGSVFANPTSAPSTTPRAMTEYDGSLPQISDTSNPFPDIITGVQSGVVSVYNYGNVVDIFGNTSVDVQGSGTGFVVSSEGYVVTNAHVIDDAVRVTIVLSDDTEVPCEVIGSDVSTDIAVLKFDNASYGIQALYLGNSDNVRVGEFVITVGDPSGRELAGTITFGIISAVDRTVNIDGRTNTYIQTDAAMNPGNSGGPLINTKGEVIAVTSAKTVTASYDESGNAISAEGLGFAIPINTVKSIMQGLITEGKIVRPGIGITIAPATEEELYVSKLAFGLAVHSIVAGGPADVAGIKEGDILTLCNGKELRTNDDLTAIVQGSSVGDVLNITLYRNGNKVDVDLTIGDLNEMG